DLRASNAPTPRAIDDFRKPRARFEQRDHLGQRVGHDWTLANETWTFDCSKSGCGALSFRFRNLFKGASMKTVLITGCSSGFGLETARYFLARDWKVIATMRTPRDDVMPRSEHLRVLALDVTDADSIRQAVQAAGPIDALVNNAGIGMLAALEATSMQVVR